MNRRDTNHVRWVIWNRFRYKLISSYQRNAKSLPIPSTKLHHVCEINPRDTRGCQTAQRTITLLSQTKQTGLLWDFTLKGVVTFSLDRCELLSECVGEWNEEGFIAVSHLWWSGEMCKGPHEHEGAFGKLQKILRSHKHQRIQLFSEPQNMPREGSISSCFTLNESFLSATNLQGWQGLSWAFVGAFFPPPSSLVKMLKNILFGSCCRRGDLKRVLCSEMQLASLSVNQRKLSGCEVLGAEEASSSVTCGDWEVSPRSVFRCAASEVDPLNGHQNKHCSCLRACVTLLYSNPLRSSPTAWAVSLPCLFW